MIKYKLINTGSPSRYMRVDPVVEAAIPHDTPLDVLDRLLMVFQRNEKARLDALAEAEGKCKQCGAALE